MDFAAIQAMLNDLPSTFKRPDQSYARLMDALTAELLLYGNGTDGLVQQGASFNTAVDNWIDVWGLIAGVPRNQNEGNSLYRARVSETLLAWVGTVPALTMWLKLFAPGGTITENTSGLGYVITLPASMTLSQINAFVATLNRVRPVGVPFLVQQIALGLYLGTINFLGEGRVVGSYLSTSYSNIPLPFGPLTNNAAPVLPTLYLTDPTLNA
jgi:hypothetical protein